MDGLESILVGVVGTLAASNIAAGFAGTKRPRTLKTLREQHAHGLASRLPYRLLVADNVVQLDNGALLTAFDVASPPIASLTRDGLIDNETGIARSYNQLDSRMVVHFHERFAPVFEYDRPKHYPDPYLQFLDERRAEYFLSGATFRSIHRISLAWLPPSSGELATSRLFTQRSSDVKDDSGSISQQLLAFDKVCEKFVNAISLNAEIRRLGLKPWEDRFGTKRVANELLSHLASCLTGAERRVEHPGIGAYVNGLISVPFRGGFDVRVGKLETQIVIVKQCPQRTREVVFEALKPLGIPYEQVTRWLPNEPVDSMKTMRDAYELWSSKTTESRVPDPTNLRMMEDASAALSLITDAGLRFGAGSVWFMVRHPDVAIARRGAENIASKLTNIGYDSSVASLTSEDDFFGCQPGDGYHGVRKYPLHSLNMANVFSLHGDSCGRRYAESPTLPDKTPAILYARNRAGTATRVHLHHDPRDVAMWMAVGGMGRGKSVTSNLIGAGWLARGGNTGWSVLEKGGSSYRLNRWLNGAFIRPCHPNAPGIALFADIEQDEDANSVLALLKVMLDLQGVDVTPTRDEALSTAMDNMRHFPADKRHLRDLSAFIEQLQDASGEMRAALGRYTKNGGIIGAALDTTEDHVSVARMTTVEISNILALNDPKYIIPVLGAILWKLRRAVKIMRERQGRADLNWGYTIDEAHALLELEQGCRFIAEMYREARKEQLWLGLLTQSITHYAKSPIAADIRTACGRGFWFKNASLRESGPSDGPSLTDYYKQMGCPDRGIIEIPGLVGWEVGISDDSSGTFDVVTWEPDAVTKAILGRSRGAFNTPSDNSNLDDYIRKYPKTWREELLKAEGVSAKVISQMLEIVQFWNEQQEEMLA